MSSIERERGRGRGRGRAFNAPWINASHRHLPPTAFLRVKHAYPSIHPYHSFHVATIYTLPFHRHAYLLPYLPAWIYNHPPFIYEFYKSIVFHRVFAVARLLRNSSNWRSMVLEIERGDVYFNAILLLFERISHCPLSRVYAIGESLFVKLIKQSLSGFIE